MLAKAAASAMGPSSGQRTMDATTARIIQYKTAIHKLTELVRLVGIIVPNLQKRWKREEEDPELNEVIIPLSNFVLALCEGPMFNVHPTLRKRFNLLCEFKLCKLQEVVPSSVSTSAIEIEVIFPSALDNLDQYRSKIYNKDLQLKLLLSVQSLASNALDIYHKKLRQIHLEKLSTSKAGSSASNINWQAMEDILKPTENSLALDLAVLINDFEKNTNDESLHKLQRQVLDKFLGVIKGKVWPVWNQYHLNLMALIKNMTVANSNGMNMYNTNLNLPSSTTSTTHTWKSIPYGEYTLHRCYSLSLRIIYLLNMWTNLFRHIYYPSFHYFHDIRTKLLSENVLEYEDFVHRLHVFCEGNEPNEYSMTEDTLIALEMYSHKNTVVPLNLASVIDIERNCVAVLIETLEKNMNLVEEWTKHWKYCAENEEGLKSYKDLNESELRELYDAKIEKDRTLLKSGKDIIDEKPAVKKEIMKTTKIIVSPRKPNRPRSQSLQNKPPNGKNSANSTSVKQTSRSNSMESNVIMKQRMAQDAFKHIMKSSMKNGTRLVNNISGQHSPSPEETTQNHTKNLIKSKKIDTTDHDAPKKEIYTTFNGGEKKDDTKKNNVDVPKGSLEEKPNTIENNDLYSRNSENIVSGSISTINDGVGRTVEAMVSGASSTVKKVRFIGVPPMTEAENPKPTKKGWYKKPAVLHYPPVPSPQHFASIKDNVKQEGIVFTSTLREALNNTTQELGKRTTMMMNLGLDSLPGKDGNRFASKLREKSR